MQNGATLVLSLLAMAMSVVTTYLSFFDERITLTASIDKIEYSLQSGGGGSEGAYSYSFAPYLNVSTILSLRGARPVVMTDAELVRSATPGDCVGTDDVIETYGLETTILEPGTLRSLTIEYALPRMEAEAARPEDLKFEPRSDFWCLRYTLYDPSGERRQPASPAFATDITFFVEEGEDYPSAKLEIDVSRGAKTILEEGALF